MRIFLLLVIGAALLLIAPGRGSAALSLPQSSTGAYVVLAYNDLGMHCMNEDFSEFMILPPFNTLHAQVIMRTSVRPKLVTNGVTVDYEVPGNTTSCDKTNFWDWTDSLFGFSLPEDVGLTGQGLWGRMAPTGAKDWVATGIPITPLNDAGEPSPYNLATVTVRSRGKELAKTRAVVPVSWEISCWLCHNGSDAPLSVLDAHDRLHGTSLYAEHEILGTSILCGACHEQPELGALAPGTTGVPTLSRSMHMAHAPRMSDVLDMTGGVSCYACHPGMETQCLRDVHYQAGMSCDNCHVSMEAVASPDRRPWTDMPRCDSCHHRPGSQYEQAGVLYRNSRSHGNVQCEACHGSPHAITPTIVAADNIQAIQLQGYAGAIADCRVCHGVRPRAAFRHAIPGLAL